MCGKWEFEQLCQGQHEAEDVWSRERRAAGPALGGHCSPFPAHPSVQTLPSPSTNPEATTADQALPLKEEKRAQHHARETGGLVSDAGCLRCRCPKPLAAFCPQLRRTDHSGP